ncbi:Cell cycle serine/threonine-protein kinase cdc5/MSD2 [Linnemannia exigua]|uniref:Serine/threonine-protein kinase n=1 Tax=Linnemannia exigua TaxID=604196 RepID=A0AAD4DDS4_9FUNG|nr:Cell cycle serine/threonine-protein kinase cdc5/MSD2 [Linnemannia exigua]
MGIHNNNNTNTQHTQSMMGGGMMTTTTNTHMVTAATTTTTTTATTNNPDKPKSRKKDKAPRIPPPDLIVDNNGKMSYTRGPPLGEGGFASCFMISDQKNGRFAAKVIQKTELQTAKARHKLFAEIKIHQDRTHKNIVKYYHCFEDDNFVYLVLELCECKTLMELIKRRKRLTEPEVRYYVKQIVAGCAYLHDEKIIHRDLKLGNIFLTKDLQVRIGDFGLAAVLLNEGDRKKTICGTPNYIAPEILFDTDNGHSFEVDVWSVGVIMYTLLIGKPPFQTNEVKAIYKKIRDNIYEFPKDVPISEEAKSLIARLLDPKPKSRPSIATVTKHAFFTSGYCPAKLERTALESAPNFDREERLFKQERLQQQMQQQWDEQQAANALPSKRYEDFTADMLDQMPTTPPPSHQQSTPIHPHAAGVDQHHDPTRYTHNDASSSSRPIQQHQNSLASGSRLQYGDKFKIEMVDGDKVTTEIRTMNGPRMRAAPDFAQFSQAHARIQKEQQQQQQQQQRQEQQSHMSSTATGNDLSTLTPQQANKTERGGSSRLPVPRSRVTLPPNTTSFQQSHASDIDQSQQQQHSALAATPTKASFKSPLHNIASPRPQTSMGMGASSPNLSGLPRSSIPVQHQRQESQLGTSQSPSPMNRRRSSDMVSIPGGSTFGKALIDRRTETKRLGIATEEPADTPQSGIDDLFSPVALTPSRFSYHEEEHQRTPQQRDGSGPLSSQQAGQRRLRQHDDFMDLDSENLIVSQISEIQPPYTLPNHSQSKRQPTLSQSHQDQSAFQNSQARYSEPNGRGRQGESTSPSTLIQNVHGVERPASAMQRTFSQEREMSEMGRGVGSPRKVLRTSHTHHHHQSSLDGRGMSPFNPTASLSQPQQHSFLQSSQHGPYGSNTPVQTLRHHSSQPLSTHQRYATTTASSPSLRLSSQSNQHWPIEVEVVNGSTNPTYREETVSPGSSPKLTHIAPPPTTLSFPPSPTHRPRSLPMERTRSHPNPTHVGLGLSVSDQNDYHGAAFGGMVRPAPEEEPRLTPVRPPSSLSVRQPTPSLTPTGGQGVGDPYRRQHPSQHPSPLHRRNHQANQQKLLHQSVHAQSPTPPSPSPAKSMTKISVMSSLPSFPSLASNAQQQQQQSLPLQQDQGQRHDQSSNSNSQSLSPALPRSYYSSQQQEDSGSLQSQQKRMQHRSRQIAMVSGSGMDASTSNSESSMSMSSADESRSLEIRRKQQLIEKRQLKRNGAASSQLRTVSSLGANEAGDSQQDEAEQDEVEQGGQGLTSAGGSNNAHHHQNGHNKQSNETTMAGMSSGGNSDEQDHVEVPSTSCITTNSLSLSMHRDHPAHQQKQQQQQQQQLQMHLPNNNNNNNIALQPHEDTTVLAHSARTERLRQSSSYTDDFSSDIQQTKLRHSSSRLGSRHSSRGPRKLGSQGETELYLRTQIEARRTGQLEYPARDLFVPTAPEVFVVRWVNYKHRYGFGFQLSNSVVGVIFNDNTTAVLAPAGEDVEIIHGTARLTNSSSMPADQMSKNSKDGDKEEDDSTPRATPAFSSSKNQQVSRSRSSSRTVKVEEEESHTGATDRTVSRETNSRLKDVISASTTLTTSTPRVRSGSIKDIDTYDKLDDEDYLKTLERSYCRKADVPSRLGKKVTLLSNFKSFMQQCLRGTPPWTYVDTDLRRNMPFLTDICQNVHVVSRLSNGITQVNFADHTKIVLSQRGRVVTFLDNDEKSRRVTLTTAQALSAEYFYNLDDPRDHTRTVQEELKMINHARSIQDALDQRRELFDQDNNNNNFGGSSSVYGKSSRDSLQLSQPRETRPTFNSDKDIDLYLFPRPNLSAQIARASQGILQSTEDLLAAGLDASQVEERVIANSDKRAVIRRMTFKALHTQIVLRLRIAQRLMRERAIELAEERLEREKDGSHSRRRSRSKHHQHRSKESRETRDSKESKRSSRKEGGGSSSANASASASAGGGGGSEPVVVKADPDDMSGVQQQHLEQDDEDMISRIKTEPMSEVHYEGLDLEELDHERPWQNVRVKIEGEEDHS